MDPRAVVFDLDDTLADTCGTVLEPAQRAAVREMVSAGLRAGYGEALAALHEIRRRDPGARFLRILVERFGADDPEACHDRARLAFFASRPEAIRPVPGARALLRALRARGIRLFLVTFGVVEAQERKLDVLGIRDLFEEVRVLPLEGGPDKTEVLRAILERTGLAPGEVWVVGDRTPGEIRAGNRLGMHTIRVRRGEFASLEPAGPEEVPDLTISEPRELLSLLS